MAVIIGKTVQSLSLRRIVIDLFVKAGGDTEAVNAADADSKSSCNTDISSLRT